MTKRYFVRGVGVGLIIAAAIFFVVLQFTPEVIYKPVQNYSDEEIKTKAKELGMIFVSDVNNNEREMLTENEIIEKARALGMIYPNESDNNGNSDEVDQSNDDEVKTDVVTTKVNDSEVINEVEENSFEPEKITITIPYGASSEDIALILKEYGVIDDTKAFNSYIYKNDYSKKLQFGTYEFTYNMSIDEIVKILKKRS